MATAAIYGFIGGFLGIGSAGSWIGGVLFSFPAIRFTVAEWQAFYRGRADVERQLGYAMFALSALAIFGVAANLGEALTSTEEVSGEFLVWLLAIGIPISTYAFLCGLFRTRAPQAVR